MPPTKKEYTNLLEARSTGYFDPKYQIGRCSAILPNRMQCWRAADFHVVEVIPATTEPPTEERTVEYQLCKQHVNIQKGEDLELLQEEEAATLKQKQDAEAKAADPIPVVPTTIVVPPVVSSTDTSGSPSLHEQMKATLSTPVESAPPANSPSTPLSTSPEATTK